MNLLLWLALTLSHILRPFGLAVIMRRDTVERIEDGWVYVTPHGPPRLGIGRYQRPTTYVGGATLAGGPSIDDAVDRALERRRLFRD